MTFEVPKLQGNEYQFFTQKTKSPSVKGTPIPFGGYTTGGAGGSSSLNKELKEIAAYGNSKVDNAQSIGLGGAPTPDEGKGSHLWTYC